MIRNFLCLAAALLCSASALASGEVKLEDLEVVSEEAVSKEAFQEKLSAGLNRASGFNRPDWVTEGNRPDWYTDGNRPDWVTDANRPDWITEGSRPDWYTGSKVDPAFVDSAIPSPSMGDRN